MGDHNWKLYMAIINVVVAPIAVAAIIGTAVFIQSTQVQLALDRERSERAAKAVLRMEDNVRGILSELGKLGPLEVDVDHIQKDLDRHETIIERLRSYHGS